MTGDFGGLFVLALIWLFFKLVSRSREESAPPPARRESPPGLGSLNDPPQEEGRALRMLLRELEKAMNQGGAASRGRPAGSTGRPAARPLPPAEEMEGRDVLEVAPEVESLEREPRRAERAAVDQDDEALQVIARRAASTAARAGDRIRADRQKVDPRIRREPSDHTATRALTPRQLRDAIVWREILGRPVSERDR